MLTLEAVLYVYELVIVTGPCRLVTVRINPFQTLRIRSAATLCSPYLHRGKPFFILIAHAMRRLAVPYVIPVFNRGVPY